MRIDPSPLLPPDLGTQPSPQAPTGASFASMLGGGDAPAEPSGRAHDFLELGMFGAVGAVSPISLAIHGLAAASSAPDAAEETGSPSPAQPLGAAAEANPTVAAAAEPPARPAGRVAEGETNRQPDLPRGPESARPSYAIVAAAPDEPVSTLQPRPPAAPVSVRIEGARMQFAVRPIEAAAPEEKAAGAAPAKMAAEARSPARAPLAASLIEQGATAKLAVAAASLAPGERARLRQIAARLLAEHGLELGDMWINGGSEPASAPQGGSHGSRTR